MNKVIQIRATNAMGKTTIVRQFIKKHKLQPKEIEVDSKKVFITTSKDYKTVILGKYGDKWGGCDSFENRKQVFNTILYVIKKFAPENIIFEGLLYGKTFLFASNLDKYIKKYNYKYIGITLNADFKFALERLKKRNNGEEINIEVFYNTWYSVLNSYKKLIQNNIDVRLIDITNINYKDMIKILEEVISHE